MPQLKIRGVEVEKICSFSKNLIGELETIINCPRSYFTIEHISSTFIADGSVSKAYPFVEISWFDRGQDVQDKTAVAVTKAVQGAGYENVDVIFSALKENDYYENGCHF
jgi:phenylpyruvate tautomerase PptA (4-oxalocrotonate tautomerase family)